MGLQDNKTFSMPHLKKHIREFERKCFTGIQKGLMIVPTGAPVVMKSMEKENAIGEGGICLTYFLFHCVNNSSNKSPI